MTELATTTLPIYSLLVMGALIIDSCLKLRKWLNDQEVLENTFKLIFIIPVFIYLINTI